MEFFDTFWSELLNISIYTQFKKVLDWIIGYYQVSCNDHIVPRASNSRDDDDVLENALIRTSI